MGNTTTKQRDRVGARGAPVRVRDGRAAVARSVFGTWKRPLKQSVRTLAGIRRGLSRRIG